MHLLKMVLITFAFFVTLSFFNLTTEEIICHVEDATRNMASSSEKKRARSGDEMPEVKSKKQKTEEARLQDEKKHHNQATEKTKPTYEALKYRLKKAEAENEELKNELSQCRAEPDKLREQLQNRKVVTNSGDKFSGPLNSLYKLTKHPSYRTLLSQDKEAGGLLRHGDLRMVEPLLSYCRALKGDGNKVNHQVDLESLVIVETLAMELAAESELHYDDTNSIMQQHVVQETSKYIKGFIPKARQFLETRAREEEENEKQHKQPCVSQKNPSVNVPYEHNDRKSSYESPNVDMDRSGGRGGRASSRKQYGTPQSFASPQDRTPQPFSCPQDGDTPRSVRSVQSTPGRARSPPRSINHRGRGGYHRGYR